MIPIIAEVGINHNGDLETAKKLINLASLSKCSYVKLQKRNPEICVPENQKNKKKSTPWGEMTYLEYKKKIEFNFDDYTILHKYCLDFNIKLFCSVWDIDSAEFMLRFNNEIVKIPSAHLTNKSLIKYCRQHFKKLIISTGMSTENEIEEAVNYGKPDIIMHTNSAYPSPLEELNLKYIKYLKNKYKNIKIGYSGHEYDIQPTVWACALGAEIVERHITLSQNLWGSDQKSSVEPIGLFKLRRELDRLELTLKGNKPRICYNSEKEKRESLRGV